MKSISIVTLSLLSCLVIGPRASVLVADGKAYSKGMVYAGLTLHFRAIKFLSEVMNNWLAFK